MFKLLIILILTVICNSFININNKKISNIKLNIVEDDYKPIFYNEYNSMKPTYTILSKYTHKLKELINELQQNQVNHIYIDAKLFKNYELEQICEHYSITKVNLYNENDPLIFHEDKEYIGGIFEMHEIIMRYDM